MQRSVLPRLDEGLPLGHVPVVVVDQQRAVSCAVSCGLQVVPEVHVCGGIKPTLSTAAAGLICLLQGKQRRITRPQNNESNIPTGIKHSDTSMAKNGHLK